MKIEIDDFEITIGHSRRPNGLSQLTEILNHPATQTVIQMLMLRAGAVPCGCEETELDETAEPEITLADDEPETDQPQTS